MKNNTKRWFQWDRITAMFGMFFYLLGNTWLLLTVAHHMGNEGFAWTQNLSFIIVLFLTMLGIAIFRNRPKSSFKYKLRKKDNIVKLVIGDAFNNSGALIIPINDHFCASLNGHVTKESSLQNQLIQRYYANKSEHLQSDISKKLSDHPLPCDIGTVIEVEQQTKTFFLVANTRKKENNRVEGSADDFLSSLHGLWRYISQETGRHSSITVPLISTGRARIPNFDRESAIIEIINSYIESSKRLDICETLIISVLPSDIEKFNISIDKIARYLEFSCNNYRIVEFTGKLKGKEISPSEIKSIKNN